MKTPFLGEICGANADLSVRRLPETVSKYHKDHPRQANRQKEMAVSLFRGE
jgi:hypothetical protein